MGKFPDGFRREIDDAEVVTLDLPGNGALHRQTSPTRVEEMAEYCRRELAARGLPPPYRVLALSLGAMVAVSWCAQYPAEVESCVLINTSLRPFSPFYRRLRPHNYPQLIYAALHGDIHRRERLILQLTSCRADAHAALVGRVGRFATRMSGLAPQYSAPIAGRHALSRAAHQTANADPAAWQRTRPIGRRRLFAQPGARIGGLRFGFSSDCGA